jgi:AcrR family transcriptional regulator
MNDPSAHSGHSGRAARTRQALLDAGRRALAARGFEATTSTVVAAEAGVATGTFYAYFADKHVLLAELFAASLDALVDAQERVLTADMLLDEGLKATMARAVDVCVEGFLAEGPVLRVALARIPVDPQLRSIYWERHRRAVDVAERFLRRAEAAGAMPVGDRQARAQALVVLLEGLNHPAVLAEQPSAQPIRAACAGALLGLLDGDA